MFETVEVIYVCTEHRRGCAQSWKEQRPKILHEDPVQYVMCANCERQYNQEMAEIVKEVD